MKNTRFVKNNSGVAALEFALIVPVLVLIMTGLIDGGEAFLKYRAMTQVSESVVRMATFLTTGATQDTSASIDPASMAIIKRGVDLATMTTPIIDLNVSLYVLSKPVIVSKPLSVIPFIVSGNTISDASFDTEASLLLPGETIIACQIEYLQPVFFNTVFKPFNIKIKYLR